MYYLDCMALHCQLNGKITTLNRWGWLMMLSTKAFLDEILIPQKEKQLPWWNKDHFLQVFENAQLKHLITVCSRASRLWFYRINLIFCCLLVLWLYYSTTWQIIRWAVVVLGPNHSSFISSCYFPRNDSSCGSGMDLLIELSRHHTISWTSRICHRVSCCSHL